MGAVQIKGDFSLLPCPSLDPVWAVPLETSIAHSIHLSASVSDPAEDAAGQEVYWRADNGWTAVGESVQFPCTTVGSFRVTASVRVGSGECASTRVAPSATSAVLTCSEPLVPNGEDFNGGN